MRRQSPTLAATRRQALLRHLTVWVGLLCLSAQFSSVLHMLLVEHVRCAEHGELAHAGGDEHDDHGRALREASSSGPAISSSSSQGDHGHDHCLTCSERRKLAILPPASLELRAPERDGALLAFGRDASVHPVSVCSYAPKTSPPV